MKHPIQHIVLGTCAMVCASLLAIPTASSFARDADGSRMKARPQAIGTTQKDRIMPPRDRVDWRSFRVTKKQRITISVRHSAKSGPVQVSLTSSQGAELQSATSTQGGATLSTQLKPGIYYVAVSARRPSAYSITLR